MNLRRCIDEYIAYRRALGAAFHGESVRLIAFARATGDLPMAQITPDQVLAYLNGTGPVTTFWLQKYHTLTGLYRFAISRGYVTASPLPKTKPTPQRKFVPYIFSQDDMVAMLRAVDERHTPSWLLRPTTVRTLLLLLYATGLRISEALALDLGDVDLTERILTIRDTKFYKSRLVPFGTDLLGVLTRYAIAHHGQSDGSSSIADETPFLVDRNGHRILRQTSELAYKAVRKHAGLGRPAGFKFYPRLHDLRHTFAVNRLASWYRQGRNVQRLLPHLATYLGHHSIRETQRYLSLTDDVAMEAGARFLSYALPMGTEQMNGK